MRGMYYEGYGVCTIEGYVQCCNLIIFMAM